MTDEGDTGLAAAVFREAFTFIRTYRFVLFIGQAHYKQAIVSRSLYKTYSCIVRLNRAPEEKEIAGSVVIFYRGYSTGVTQRIDVPVILRTMIAL